METPTIMSYTSGSSTVDPYKAQWLEQQGLAGQVQFNDLLKNQKYKKAQKEKNMSGKRVVQVFVVDPNENLKAGVAMLYKSEQQFTDLTDQELFFEIDIKPILEKHNGVRAETLDRTASNKAGKDIFLEPIRIRDLKMVVSTIAEF